MASFNWVRLLTDLCDVAGDPEGLELDADFIR